MWWKMCCLIGLMITTLAHAQGASEREREDRQESVLPTRATILGLPPLAEIIAHHDTQLAEILAQKEEDMLTDEERVTVEKRVLLRPHARSAIQDVLIEAFQLSTGETGYFLVTPIFTKEVTGPFAYRVDEINLTEGWYTVRVVTGKELEKEQRKKHKRKQQQDGEPTSWLHTIWELFRPASANACTGGPRTKSVYQRVQNKFTGQTVVEDGVKMTWRHDKGDGGKTPRILSTARRCLNWAPFSAFPGCSPIQTKSVNVFIFPGWQKAARAQRSGFFIYYTLLSPLIGVDIRTAVTGMRNGSWWVRGTCFLNGNLNFVFRCTTIIDGF